VSTKLIVKDGHPTLRHEERAALGSILQAQVIELIDLALLGKHLHWNVTGPGFRETHEQLDELVAQWQERADAAAERGRALGVCPDGRSVTVAQHSALPSVEPGEVRIDAAVAALVGALDEAITGARERIERAGEYDAVTAEVLIKTVALLERQRWMLAAAQ